MGEAPSKKEEVRQCQTGSACVTTVTPFYYLSVLSHLILASDLIFLRLRAYCFSIVMIPL
jgi:hypothetical protein